MIPVEKAHMRVAAASDPGMKGKNNEDQFAVTAYQLSRRDPKPVVFAIVADGIGGHRAGEVASDIAVEMICDAISSSDGSQPLEIMQAAIMQASQAIYAQGSQNTDQVGMGTTCVCVWVIDDRLYATHVGNSRLYLFRHSDLYQLNVDHTWVREAVDAGALTPEQARAHPNANIIRRYLGASSVPEVDTRIRTDRSNHYSRENQGFRLRSGDRLLLCSDGLNDMVVDQRIAEELTKEDPDMAVSGLIAAANRNGGKDNITVVILDMPKKSGLQGFWDQLKEIPSPLAFAYAGLGMMGLAVLSAVIMFIYQLFNR